MDVATNKITAFQIKPDLQNVFKSAKVKELIQKTLQETLVNKSYQKETAPVWIKQISDDINKQLAEQSSQKYKYVVTTVISEKLGQGCRLICRTRWDSESDRQVSESFTNESLFCICTVFAIFLY
ncbi:unnamed protein product [Diamesa serratosioi]